jgi:uncharacterized membrane protein HdeD (DUF308 family)
MRLHWQLFLVQGIIMLILGALDIIWILPQISALAIDIYVGWLFLLSGIAGLLAMFLTRDVRTFVWMLLTAAPSLLLGLMLVWQPAAGTASLIVLLAAFFIAEGVVQIVASLSYQDVFSNQWGWVLASGITDLILAGIIIAGWPGTTTWALGLSVGVNLLTSGAAITMVTLAEGREVHKI